MSTEFVKRRLPIERFNQLALDTNFGNPPRPTMRKAASRLPSGLQIHRALAANILPFRRA